MMMKSPQMLMQDRFAMMQQQTVVSKKQRELHAGNFANDAQGNSMVTSTMLEQLFDMSLTMLAPKCVLAVSMDAQKRYAFIEFKTAEIATAAMQLNGVELLGRPLRLSRPGGYVEPPPPKPLLIAGAPAAEEPEPVVGVPTPFLRLDNLVAIEELSDDATFKEIYDDVLSECNSFGEVLQLLIPRPKAKEALPTGKRVRGLGQAWVGFKTVAGASKAQLALDGREFGANKVRARFIPEMEFVLLVTTPLADDEVQAAAPLVVPGVEPNMTAEEKAAALTKAFSAAFGATM
jgi:splicing factor U2AF subunit